MEVRYVPIPNHNHLLHQFLVNQNFQQHLHSVEQQHLHHRHHQCRHHHPIRCRHLRQQTIDTALVLDLMPQHQLLQMQVQQLLPELLPHQGPLPHQWNQENNFLQNYLLLLHHQIHNYQKGLQSYQDFPLVYYLYFHLHYQIMPTVENPHFQLPRYQIHQNIQHMVN